MENKGESHIGYDLLRGIFLSSSPITFGLGSVISKLLSFYVEKQEKCRSTIMQIRNASQAALSTLESKSRSSMQP